MIRITDTIIKNQPNFWNNCIFHPTDAVEDSWGKRILDRIAKDKSIHTVRVYAMFEDIVYDDGEGNIAFDFRTSDTRLDYLVDSGFDILIAYGMLPKICVENPDVQSAVANGKTRYKGKMLYTSRPTERGHEIWEQTCYEYTKHIVERYGIETVSKWHLHCYNEPDIPGFFLADLPSDSVDPSTVYERAKEYCKLYKGFVNGILKVSDKLRIGGPSLGGKLNFLDYFLKYVKEENLRLDYIALHNYAGVHTKNCDKKGFNVDDWLEEHYRRFEVIKANGFENTELVYDEWGMAMAGFYDVAKCPHYQKRDTEVFSAYYAKLIYELINRNIDISMLMICLSGQHEMVTDFSGFRNFFTLNFIAKPIYSAYVLGSKLYRGLLGYECENKDICVVPTKSDDGKYSILMTYCVDGFSEDALMQEQEIVFDEDIIGKKVRIWCIDKNNNNPYRMYERMGKPEMTDEIIKVLKAEGNIKPISEFVIDGRIRLEFSANATYLVEVM
ncbi:MAG: hypothetical protein E7583_05335 [Ruminococcaceae bacterium]|nr:hypothetical protein [Oscillospiraceae bacterium]